MQVRTKNHGNNAWLSYMYINFNCCMKPYNIKGTACMYDTGTGHR